MSATTAPDISLPATGEQDINLASLRGQTLVVYFYPKDNTPGCTNETRDFGALHAQFVEAGARVFGVSRDGIKSHENFKAKLELPFDLISDADEALCQAFDVIKMKNMYGKQVRGIERSTFVIDADGTICKEWRKVKVDDHAQAVLDFVRSL